MSPEPKYLQMHEKYRNHFKNLKCVIRVLFLCTTVFTTLHCSNVLCPEDWIWSKYSLSCIRVFEKQVDWEEARDTCRLFGGHLVAIENEEMNNFLANLLKNSYEDIWIGLNDKKTDNVFEWVDTNKKYDYSNWAGTNPNGPANTNIDCCQINNKYGKKKKAWTDDRCNQKAQFICERHQGQLCPPTWIFSPPSGTCIKYFSEKSTWKDARIKCQGESADLVSIFSDKSNDFVSGGRLDDSSSAWIGFNNLDTSDPHANRWLEYELKFSFRKLSADETTSSVSSGQRVCGQMFHATAQPWDAWTLHSCSVLTSFICEKYKDPKTACRSGWMWSSSSGTCLKMYNNEETWQTAKQICTNDDADLLMILSDEMNTFLTEYLSPHGSTFWIGFNDIEQEGDYRWIEYTDKIVYKNMAANGSPNDDAKDCVEVNDPSEGWAPQICTHTNKFICETFPENCEKVDGAACPKLASECSSCYENACNRRTGACSFGCLPGFTGPFCKECKNANMYGPNCNKTCSPHCGGPNKACNISTGACLNSCAKGFDGKMCRTRTECENAIMYGPNCNNTCSPHCGGPNKTCNFSTGACLHGCAEGFVGKTCLSGANVEKTANLTKMLVPIIGAVLGLLLFCFLIPKRTGKREEEEQHTNDHHPNVHAKGDTTMSLLTVKGSNLEMSSLEEKHSEESSTNESVTPGIHTITTLHLEPESELTPGNLHNNKAVSRSSVGAIHTNG